MPFIPPPKHMAVRSALIFTMLSASAWAASIKPADVEFFEKRIRPVLIKHCYECHSAKSKNVRGGLLLDSNAATLKGGDTGPAVVAGDLDESLLIEAIRYDGFEMPPNGKLPANVIADFEKWVLMGAPDPRTGPAATLKRKEIDIEQGREFWSFQPLDPGPLPEVKDTDWLKSDIDRFIISRMESKGVPPTIDADRESLIRRAYFDLIGLPPTPEQINAFVDDRSPRAFAKVVDELLSSSHYGERWGRHWLDVTRFAESSGGGRSLMFRDAWRFRDYVIDSFNNDKPFDQLIREHIAGDLLPAANLKQRNEQIVGSGFLALGATNYELQDKALLRMEVVDEQITVIGRAFMAMTLGCARCHDHKFDPIPTHDYYALAGIFRSTKSLVPGNVSGFVQREIPENETQQQRYQEHLAESQRIEKELKQAQADLKKLGGASPVAVADANGKSVPISSLSGVVLDSTDAKVVGGWTNSVSVGYYIGDDYIHASAGADNQQKSVTYQPRLPSAGAYEVRISYSAHTNRATNTPVQIRHRLGMAQLTVNQRKAPEVDGVFQSLGKFQFSGTPADAVTISVAGADGVVIADAVQFLPDATTTQSDPAAIANNNTTSKQTTDRKDSEQQALVAQRDSLNTRIRELEKSLKQLKKKAPPAPPKAMSVQDQAEPGDWHLHIRGGIRNLGPLVPRGFLQVAMTGDAPPTEIPQDKSGRLELAEWLASPTHPLTARVYVNRVWHHLFGVGLVRTTDNFGTMGERPSHSRLLDYLADRFIRNGWSTKRLIRDIMLSRAYQLSTKQTKASQQHDPENRLFAHANRRRLQAEALRDAILSVSGRLDKTSGGLTIRKITQYDNGYQFDTVRRSVYVPQFRNSILDFFAVFDIANPNLVTGRRNVSTIPTQALFLMNSPFVMEQAEHAARRLLEYGDLDDAGRLERAYRQTLGRSPFASERKITLEYLQKSREQDEADHRQAELATWTSVYHSLFACVDFRYI